MNSVYGLNVPSNWQVVSLDQVKADEKKALISGPFGSNISAKYFTPTGVPVIRGNNLSLDVFTKFKDTGFVFVSDEKAEELGTWAQVDDIIFTVVGTLGQIGLISQKQNYTRYIISNKQIRLRLDQGKVTPHFVYYWLASDLMQEIIEQRNTGSSVPLINLGVVKSLLMPLPLLPEQKAIASVLSSLDDKIDLLHRQNKTLEAMAETLFRQWFVEEAKEDWGVRSLGDVVKIAYGKNLSTSKLLETGYPVFGGNGQIGFYDRFLYAESQVLVSCRGEASGKVNISLPNSFITNNSLVLERKENGITFEYLKFYALAYDFGLHVSGSAQPQITIDGLFNAEFKWPPLQMVDTFTEVVRPIEDKRLTNYLQIQTLEQLRDTLLPKLMSGEVRVQYQTEEVA